MYRNKVGILALMATLGFAACDDSTTAPGELTTAEAEALAEILLTQTLTSGILETQGAAAPVADELLASAIVEFSETVSGTLPCPLGGSVMVEGTASGTQDTETQETSFNFSVVQVHSDCGATSQEGVDFVVDGSPSIASTFQMDLDANFGIVASGATEGGIDWSYEDRTGSCSIDLEFNVEGSFSGSGSGSVAGTVCGITISRSYSIAQ